MLPSRVYLTHLCCIVIWPENKLSISKPTQIVPLWSHTQECDGKHRKVNSALVLALHFCLFERGIDELSNLIAQRDIF